MSPEDTLRWFKSMEKFNPRAVLTEAKPSSGEVIRMAPHVPWSTIALVKIVQEVCFTAGTMFRPGRCGDMAFFQPSIVAPGLLYYNIWFLQREQV